MDQNVTVLCVDDDIFIQKMVATFLEGYFRVVLAYSAEEGLDLLQTQGPFDIVISDYEMPGMKGVEFLRLVRELWPETTRILASGGGADPEVVTQAISAGNISHFLSKPFDVISLRNLLIDERNEGAARAVT